MQYTLDHLTPLEIGGTDTVLAGLTMLVWAIVGASH